MGKQVRRYSFKLYPNAAQEAALVNQCVLTAQLWNAALEQREQAYENHAARSLRDCLTAPSVLIKSHPRKGQIYIVDSLEGEAPKVTYYDQAREIKFIRADDPRYAEMSCASLELTLKALDLAFQAFFRRAKNGDGAASGYPQFKSAFPSSHRLHTTIWHRDGKGWKMTPRGKNWQVYAKGIPGVMTARGKLPLAEVEHRDMQIMRRGGEWFVSVVVKQDARMRSGNQRLDVEFDLIDEFATVKNRANGQHLPGWDGGFISSDEQITEQKQGDILRAGELSLNLWGDGGCRPLLNSREYGEPSLNLWGDGGYSASTPDSLPGELSLGLRGDDGVNEDRLEDNPCDLSPDFPGNGGFGNDVRQSMSDARFKKFSYRWKHEKRLLAKRQSRDARRRRESLHKATSDLISRCSELRIIAPKIKESTASARGTERNHGAAVKTVAMLNRHILAQAPATTIQMLEYKAAEAGIPFARVYPEEHKVAIGRDIPAVVKLERKTRRKLTKMAA